MRHPWTAIPPGRCTPAGVPEAFNNPGLGTEPPDDVSTLMQRRSATPAGVAENVVCHMFRWSPPAADWPPSATPSASAHAFRRRTPADGGDVPAETNGTVP
jgi:hypothetical protein